jgi:hypothetical protein
LVELKDGGPYFYEDNDEKLLQNVKQVFGEQFIHQKYNLKNRFE